jgi:preprotein translocase subunit SecD
VQVPGVEDPEALKNLIGQTARLEFKLVDLTADPAQVQEGRAPAGSQVLPMADGSGFMAVQRRVMVSGDQLVDAKQSFDQDGRPVVDITFNAAGARRFGRVTQENVNKPFAIILDDRILSAPNINEPILGGRAQISGSFTVESANDLAISLASGKLPVKLNVVEERTVGPDLGGFDPQGRNRQHRRLDRGDPLHARHLRPVRRLFDLALIVNALMILGVMAIFNATLTLAGNRRLRADDRRRGRRQRADQRANPRGAETRAQVIDAARSNRLSRGNATGDFDANITNVIAAALMFYFGSGPVRGFAVVLMIGSSPRSSPP